MILSVQSGLMTVSHEGGDCPYGRSRPIFRFQNHSLTLHHRYFFHASDARKMDSEYNEQDSDEDDANVVDEDDQSPKPEPSSSKISPVPQEKAEEQEPELAEWFDVKEDPKSTQQKNYEQVDSETDPDSDYDEIRFDTEDAGDDWMQLKPNSEGDNEMRDASKEAQSEEVG